MARKHTFTGIGRNGGGRGGGGPGRGGPRGGGHGRGGGGRGWGWRGRGGGGRGWGYDQSSWWLWRAGYYNPYYYPYSYYLTYQSCCVALDSGTIFCAGQSYPGQILEVRGRQALVAYRGGTGWYPICEVG
jgi:hypothetical protein